MKVAAAVVTYNRKDELIKNIESMLSQTYLVDKYFIIDNHGNDNTKETLKEKGFLDNEIIEYIYLPENIGGAGGFYTAVKLAYENGYDCICLMDDDGRAANANMMEELISNANIIKKDNPCYMLNSLVYGFDKNTLAFGLKGGIKTKKEVLEKKDERGLIKNTINPFNGTLVSKELIKKIGFPNKDFFIKGDEQDYFYRALKNGAFVATIVDSEYMHPILKRTAIKILGKEYYSSTEAPWKEYYRARNFTYMFKNNKEPKKYIRQNLKQILWAIRYNKKKLKTVIMILKGWKDGIFGNLGGNVKP